MEELQTLCNVGPATAKRLLLVGIKTVAQMKKSNPEKLYEKLKAKEGGVLDKCVLYQLRGAILDIPWWKCKDIQYKKRGPINGERRAKKQNP